jgi:ABC-type polysaccharide/polyol phosphate transport system ATPase subunit
MRVIEVDSVSKTFSIPSVRRESVREHVLDLFRCRPFERLRVLDSLTFSVRRGETVGIMGRNGSGKSTLLKIIAGIYQPDHGTVTVRAPLTPILELGVGWNPELTGTDNVFLLGTVMGLSLRQIRAYMGEIFAFAELERFANLELRHYSSGMAARLAYAVAFHAAKDILVLDEIFAVGDAGFRARCEDRYRELHVKGRTVLVVSHDPRTVATFCDRALLIEHGRIAVDGAPADVAAAYLQVVAMSGGRHPDT